ncbi:uncharacterized protein LOC135698238 [Ochlerotatus camptorhynchus]|uniref:uncharacterized protein LOC135698238 n=1 Tax=Ochlerotatus camptorhynchus TaxID=644619 RepID=UPI0031DDB908
MANVIVQSVRRQHASVNTVYHALYGYYFLGISKSRLATIYGKSLATICSWIKKYDQNGLFRRKQREQVYKKFRVGMRSWLAQLYMREPMLFLDEAKEKFQKRFHITISVSSICAILHECGLSRKTIERRAIQIRDTEIVRFVTELMAIQWDIYNLIFLDEVSFDNRDMLRRKGYGVIGQKVIYRGEFCRKPRVSLLCFLGMNGMLDSFSTQGTFTRNKFFACCRNFALHNKHVQNYPGFHSVWVMHGARIHCDPNIIRYLRSIGIIPVFLPAYCPFFNTIEIIFGLVKKDLNRNRVEHSSVISFKIYSCTNIFEHCGYYAGGNIFPEKGLNQDIRQMDFFFIKER